MATKQKTMTTADVSRACTLVNCRKIIWGHLHPSKKKKAATPVRSLYEVFSWPLFRTSQEHVLPADYQTKVCNFLIATIDAELATLGVKP